MMQIFLMALITMTVFLRTKMHKETTTDGQIFMGALFFTTVMIMFNGFAELAFTILKLPVFYKQRDLLFFPAWAYALPTWILKIPFTLLESGVWVAMTYYVTGYDSNVGRFFRQYLLLIFVGQMASGLFRLMAALGRNMVIANTFGSFVLVAFLALGGYVLSHDKIKKWWIWGYWISPMTYAENAISVNEFLGNSWRHAVLSEETLAERSSIKTGEIVDLSSGKRLSESEDDARRNVSSRSMSSRVASISEDEPERKPGMVLPFEPFAITFDDIRYSVDMPQEMKAQGLTEDRLELLKGVSGSFRPGVLTALMGVSGAGKTTLMDVLAGRKTGGYIEGTITISGYPKKQDTFARIAGYCEQNDIHSPHVTVYESLQYSAWLRLPAEADAATRKMFVEEVMELVELTSLKEALVGLPGVNGLSTEQRKRLTIAVELVANPSIIFMDEPTSGLDARAAAIVMRTVRNTVDTGRTVVCTIHQPSIDIFDAFDELVLLKRGGEEIFVGPLGRHCVDLIRYFEAVDGIDKIRDGYNPATWMLEVSSIAQEAALGVNFPQIYKGSELYRRNKALIKELSTPAPGSKELYFRTRYSQPFFIQFMACLWKQHLSYWRNPHYTAVRLLFTTIIALMFGTIYWKLGSKRERLQDLLNAMGSMYSAVLFMGIQNATSVQPVVAIERTVFYRERAAGMYAALAYAFGQVVVELPYLLVQTAIYGVLVYAMIGFEWTAAKFFWYLFFMYFTLWYFTAYGMMTVAVTPNQNIAAIVSSSFYSIWNLFSGFIVPKPRIPVWWRWYYYISPVAWTLYGLVASQFGDIKEEMIDTNQTVKDFIRSYFGFKHDFLGFAALIIVAFATSFTFIFALSIKILFFIVSECGKDPLCTYQGNDRTKQMQVLNLRREFEFLRIKDIENIKEYSNRPLNVVHKIRLIRKQILDSRVVEKVLVNLPERFEAKISYLENLRDISQMTLAELANALKAPEQRRATRTEELLNSFITLYSLTANIDHIPFSTFFLCNDWVCMDGCQFLLILFFTYFTFLYFTVYGKMTVAITPNHNIAAIVSSSFYAIWSSFSGFIIPKPVVYYICPVAWTLYGLVASQFGDIKERHQSHYVIDMLKAFGVRLGSLIENFLLIF
ncbi:unnamed protein product [Coffea canephora]|uniref:ABC transporter domain-containing protein n=1 Tax=Coffea canephora TaxID=49390 RepID=A0A068U8M3_COFCA|nr:unnamed protein product [Coffea canephora]